MDYYQNAQRWYRGAKNLALTEDFQLSVYSSCLAVELYLKSRLDYVGSKIELEASHDTIKIFTYIKSRFKPTKDLQEAIKTCRKYFNESRYPFGDGSIYTKELAEKFLTYVSDIKDYIDKDCIITAEDLESKFKKPDR